MSTNPELTQQTTDKNNNNNKPAMAEEVKSSSNNASPIPSGDQEVQEESTLANSVKELKVEDKEKNVVDVTEKSDKEKTTTSTPETPTTPEKHETTSSQSKPSSPVNSKNNNEKSSPSTPSPDPSKTKPLLKNNQANMPAQYKPINSQQQQQQHQQFQQHHYHQYHHQNQHHHHHHQQHHHYHPHHRSDKTTVRFLIPAKAAGAIIGKGGANIKELREQYQALIAIPDAATPERVVRIQLQDQQKLIEVVHKISELLKDDILKFRRSKNSNPNNNNNNPNNHPFNGEENTEMRMLVHQSQAGAIIGPKGSHVKRINEETGAKINVQTEICPHSTDKVAQITGTPEAISKAVGEILVLFQNFPPKGNQFFYDPNYHDPSYEYGGYGFTGQMNPFPSYKKCQKLKKIRFFDIVLKFLFTFFIRRLTNNTTDIQDTIIHTPIRIIIHNFHLTMQFSTSILIILLLHQLH